MLYWQRIKAEIEKSRAAAGKKIVTYKIVDCSTCYGYGLWPDDGSPAYINEAVTGMVTDECPECGTDNSYYESQIPDESDYEEDGAIVLPFDTLMKRLKRCVE